MANTIQLVKQRVLDMAIKGELVEQYPNEGTGCELINEIRERKEQLIKEKKIRKEKRLDAIVEEETPFLIPKNWSWVKLGELGVTQTGNTPPRKNEKYYDGEIPFIKPDNIYPNYIEYNTEYKLTESGIEKGRFVNENSILMVCIGTLGKTYITNRICSFNQQINSLTPFINESAHTKYIYYYFISKFFQELLWEKSSATTVRILNKGRWNELVVPLPPIKEQKRIVSKIEEIFSIIDKIAEKKEDALQTIQLIRQTTLQQAIQGKLVEQNGQDEPAIKLLDEIEKEKPTLINKMGVRKPRKTSEVTEDEVLFNIPNSWIWTRLSELGLVIGGGTPKTSVEEYWEKGTISWITPADLSNYNEMYISEGNRKITDLGLEKSSAKLMPSGSVLYSSRAPIGYIAIASNPIATNQGFKSIVPYVMDTNKYIYYHLQAFTDEIESRSSGTTFKEISGTEFGKTLVPLPPLSEQKRIVEKIEHIMELCDQMEELFK